MNNTIESQDPTIPSGPISPIAVPILVNGRQKIETRRALSFSDIVILAFGDLVGGDMSFTVVYSNGPVSNPQGVLVEGQSVAIKKEMVFDVTRTNKS